VTVSGLKISWNSSHRYLGVFLESSFNFNSSYSANKASFYQAFNAIFGKVGRSASEEVLFALLKSKCLPILLYGTEACPVNSSVRQSLQFTFNRVLRKIFGAMSSDSFVIVCNFFGLKSVEDLFCARQNRFVTRYISTAKSLCGLISRKHCWPCFCSCDSCLSVKSALLYVLVCLSTINCTYVCCLFLISIYY